MKNEKNQTQKITNKEATEKLLQGKWCYHKSTTKFSDAVCPLKEGEKESKMPEYLFFGENNYGTFLEDDFGYMGDCLTLHLNREVEKFSKEDKGTLFYTSVLDRGQTLILFERPTDKEDVVLHLYTRSNDKVYTLNDIEILNKKYQKEIGVKQYPFSKNLVGYWEIYDEIKESEIESYNGEKRENYPCYTLSPLFDVLDITKKQDVYIMERGEELELTGKNRVTLFNRKNSKITISMSGTGENNFILNNQLINEKHVGTYRKIDNSEYLFVNLDNKKDLNEKIYVFKLKNRK